MLRPILTTAAALAVLAPGASAGTVGQWTRVSDAAPFVSELGVLPSSGGGALIAWSVTPPPVGPGSDEGAKLKVRQVRASGSAPRASEVIAGWFRLGAPTIVRTAPLQQQLFVAGEPDQLGSPGGIYTARHTAGSPWVVDPAVLAQTGSAVDSNGTQPVTADTDITRRIWLTWGDGLFVLRGIEPEVQIVSAGGAQFPPGAPAISAGQPSNPVWVAWQDPLPSSDPGVFARQLDFATGQPLGDVVRAPLGRRATGSDLAFPVAGGRMPLAEIGGVEWTAYAIGRPPQTPRLALWRLGDVRARFFDPAPSVPMSGASLTVTGSPGRRIWAAWRGCDGAGDCGIWVARSSVGGLRMGQPVPLGNPSTAPFDQFGHALLAAGRSGKADVFARGQTSVDGQAWFHIHALPGLHGTVLGRDPQGGGRVELRIRVDDAGVPVQGVRVGAGDETTGANGVATVTVPAGTKTVKLRRAGYAAGEVRVG